MYFAVITLFPEMFSALRGFGITGRAVDNGQVSIDCFNPRDYAQGNYRRVDERPFGGGAGMVLMLEPTLQAITAAKTSVSSHGCTNCPVIYLSPQGRTLDEAVVQESLVYDGMILLCGRYEGIDERLYQYIDGELSIGDYVLTGGELPAMVLMDGLIRRLPNVMNEQSALSDSFVDGLLDYPHYTKPLEFAGQNVPEVLLSGHHGNIAKWRFCQQLNRTRAKRPDLFYKFLASKDNLANQQKRWLTEFLQQDEFNS